MPSPERELLKTLFSTDYTKRVVALGEDLHFGAACDLRRVSREREALAPETHEFIRDENVFIF
jgi:hypothetical protein